MSPTKLYNIPRETWVRIQEEGAPDNGSVFFFDHIDGMYSLGRTQDGKIVHLAAWTPVVVIKDPRQVVHVVNSQWNEVPLCNGTFAYHHNTILIKEARGKNINQAYRLCKRCTRTRLYQEL